VLDEPRIQADAGVVEEHTPVHLADIDTDDVAVAENPGRTIEVRRNRQVASEVVQRPERQNAERNLRPDELRGDRADGSIAAGRDDHRRPACHRGTREPRDLVAARRFADIAFDPGGAQRVDDPFVTLLTYSFPSGHTLGASVFYATLTAYLLTRIASFRVRMAIAGFAGTMVLLVALSRLYLGAHFLSDVLAAAAEGIAWVGVCLMAVATLQRARTVRRAPAR
jgi:hypothetical protein